MARGGSAKTAIVTVLLRRAEQLRALHLDVRPVATLSAEAAEVLTQSVVRPLHEHANDRGAVVVVQRFGANDELRGSTSPVSSKRATTSREVFSQTRSGDRAISACDRPSR